LPVKGLCEAPVVVLEVAEISVTPGREAEFAAAYRTARELVAVSPGLRSIRMTQGIETPSRFVLLIEWDSVEAHEQGFRETDRYVKWREAIGPYFAKPPLVEHFSDVV
jgi:heme-degrading monooxygenase HmoA